MIGRPAPRVLLAVLALSANRVVPAAALVEAIWPPESGPREGNLHSQIYQLRKHLAGLEPDRASPRLVTRPPGYLLLLADAELDLAQFTALAALGREAAGAGDPAGAATLLGQALALWRGPALADVAPRSPRLEAEAAALEELRLAVLEDRVEADLAAGGHGSLAAELAGLVTAYPLRERLRGQLMLALYRSGRQAEALQAYQQARHLLAAELGIDPGPELQQLHQRILQADPSLRSPASVGGGAAADGQRAGNAQAGSADGAAGDAVTGSGQSGAGGAQEFGPRQLPAAAGHFAGRQHQLKELDAILDTVGMSGGTIVITAIGGTGGIGKTALALHWAHKAADKFPDGQLHVNLRGYDPGGMPLSTAEAIRGFLDALGIPPGQIPASAEAQVGLYRSLLAGKRMLIVLDNARDPAHVRPLLAASPGSLVLVTSRASLAGLAAADGAIQIPLGLLTDDEARQLLAARLGPERLASEPAAVAALIGLCARLPLALAITAAPGCSAAGSAAGRPGRRDGRRARSPRRSRHRGRRHVRQGGLLLVLPAAICARRASVPPPRHPPRPRYHRGRRRQPRRQNPAGGAPAAGRAGSRQLAHRACPGPVRLP
jgi:DNA-binding SARP family transcriptional activator